MEAMAVPASTPLPSLTQVLPIMPPKMSRANKEKCRACLSESRNTISLEANVPDLKYRRTYAQSFRQCTGLALNVCSARGYKLPMQICVRCCRALEVAMHFVEMAVESDSKLLNEAQSVRQLIKPGLELKRKASTELLRWNQYSQEFEQFVENYDAPIEENVLYMRGAKIPRLESDVAHSKEQPKEDDIILFDVKYDTNNIDEEEENDGSDAKNNETFFESGEINTSTIVDHKPNENNNNNYNFNNKNGDMSDLPDVECDLIQRALFMTLADDSGTSPKALATIDGIKTTLLESTEKLNVISSDQINHKEIMSDKTVNLEMPVMNENCNIPLLQCSMCKHTHTEAKQLRTHYKRVHNVDILEDEIIGFNKNQIFKCRPCNSYETKIRGDMQKHLIEHHKIDGDFEMYCYQQQNCPACKRVFKDQRSARTHYTRVHTPSSNATTSVFSTTASLQRGDSNEQFICTACDKVFFQKASQQNHQRFCQMPKPVNCTFCDEQFSTMRKYELHLQQQHSVSTLHECEVCNKTFKSAESLNIHRKRHSERHFQCDKCSLNYVNAAELKVHFERTHVHDEQVSCGTCGNKFQNFALLREHEQRNHSQKVWRCDTCAFEASSRARLRQHQYEHTGYPYKCNKCQEEFSDRTKIRQHSKKVHNMELSDDQLAEMFRDRIGYTNRHDAFAKGNNSLEIPGFNEEYFSELKSLGVDCEDITNDLFSHSQASTLDSLLDLLP